MSSAIGVAAGRYGRISLLRVDRAVAAHAHPHSHALFKVGGADSIFEVAGQCLPLVADSAVLVNPWRPHAYPYDIARGGSLVLALYVEPSWLAELNRSFGAAARPDFFPQACARIPDWIRSLVLEMAEELSGRSASSPRAAELLESLMVAVMRKFSPRRPVPEPGTGIADRRIRKAVALLREDLSRDWNLGDLADAAALSRAHFFARFRAETGLTPWLYRNALRMEAAYGGLLGSTAPLGELARQLGFAAPSHFSRFFRDNHGVAPRAYQRAALIPTCNSSAVDGRSSSFLLSQTK